MPTTELLMTTVSCAGWLKSYGGGISSRIADHDMKILASAPAVSWLTGSNDCAAFCALATGTTASQNSRQVTALVMLKALAPPRSHGNRAARSLAQTPPRRGLRALRGC